MKQYTITNWPKYNEALKKRGSITLWISKDVYNSWYSTGRTGKKGRPQKYSDEAIVVALKLREVYHLSLRAVQGFLESLLPMHIPSYTQLSRRAGGLMKKLSRLSCRHPTDIVIDSTGLKVYGEGEWKVRQHGISRRRTWKKVHLGIDPQSGEILAVEMTDASVSDATVAPELLQRVPRSVRNCYADGAYDTQRVRAEIHRRGARAIIPPRRGARVCDHTIDPSVEQRNNDILEIAGLGGGAEGRALWKTLSGYHTRSLVETMMYRLKTITGGTLRSREQSRQTAESYVKCLVVNEMTRLGMPRGYWKEVK